MTFGPPVLFCTITSSRGYMLYKKEKPGSNSYRIKLMLPKRKKKTITACTTKKTVSAIFARPF